MFEFKRESEVNRLLESVVFQVKPMYAAETGNFACRSLLFAALPCRRHPEASERYLVIRHILEDMAGLEVAFRNTYSQGKVNLQPSCMVQRVNRPLREQNFNLMEKLVLSSSILSRIGRYLL